MIHIIKNYKWVITTSLICLLLGVLTFFTFINRSFIELNALNLQVLLFVDAFLLIMFFSLRFVLITAPPASCSLTKQIGSSSLI